MASHDIYFGPKAPEDQESDGIQTVPGKGWNVIFRFQGPLQPWFDQTWRQVDIELVKQEKTGYMSSRSNRLCART